MFRTTKRILWIASAIIAVYTLVGFLALPPILRAVLTKNLSQTLHREVAIRKIRTNPYLLRVEAQGVAIKDRTPGQTFASAASLLIDLEWVSLFKLAPVVREIKVDRQTDTEGLHAAPFERRLKEQKLNDLLHHGRQAPALDDITIAPDEYPAHLEKAYRAADFPKPKNTLGMTKALPDADMQKLMLGNIQVTDNDLNDLAEARARRARDYLVESAQIVAGRIFLVKTSSSGKAAVSLNIK